MNFITKLLISINQNVESYNFILIIINQLIKNDI